MVEEDEDARKQARNCGIVRAMRMYRSILAERRTLPCRQRCPVTRRCECATPELLAGRRGPNAIAS